MDLKIDITHIVYKKKWLSLQTKLRKYNSMVKSDRLCEAEI